MALKYTRPIASARAVVRLAEQADCSALMDVNRDEQVTRFLPYDAWKSPADADAWFARMTDLQTKGLALQFVVAARSSGAAMGTCLIFQYDESSRHAALEYVLGRDSRAPHQSKAQLYLSLTMTSPCVNRWRPKVFASAAEFLVRPREPAPSCLVLDVGLPDLNGLVATSP